MIISIIWVQAFGLYKDFGFIYSFLYIEHIFTRGLTGFQYSGRLQRPRLSGKNAILNRILFGQAAEQKQE